MSHPYHGLTILMVAAGLMVLEYLLGLLAHRDGTHDFAESAATLAIAVGRRLFRPLEAGLVAVPFAFAYGHRLFEFAAATLPAVAALFLAVEFIYYWHHRLSHRVRWMWASHAVHHSPTKLNLTSGIRLSWTANISGNFLFYVPLAWLGFQPFAIVAMLGANLLYQFFLHTEAVSRLGPLERVFNTPAHHRVHHATNPSCLDRNYGGTLIVFDRLFGTFADAPPDQKLRYGLVGVSPTTNPLRILFGEWAALARDLRAAPSISDALRLVFAQPGSALPWQSRKVATPISRDPIYSAPNPSVQENKTA